MSYTPQGLVTVAFLKTQLDAGRDHLSLFEPLVLDALNHIPVNDLIAHDVRDTIRERTNLTVPIDTIQTLLGRCTKAGYLERSGGRFHKTSLDIPPSNLTLASAEIKVDQLLLGSALIAHSAPSDITFESPEIAVQSLADFISSHKLEILMQKYPIDPTHGRLKETRNLARFITEVCIPDPHFSRPLISLLEGILLADVLLMKDIHNSQMNFSNCRVYLDTRILLAALGLNGTADEIAAKEGLAAIRNAGAQTAAFERTVTEIRGILRVYEDKLSTNKGRLELFPTMMTSHMIAKRYSAADVKVMALEVEQNLKAMAINVFPYPKHIPAFTFDEQALSRILSSSNDSAEEITPRVRHDVDCVAAILTTRAGQVSYDLERSRAVFSTTSGLVVKNVQSWYADQKGEGLSPVVHHAFLTTLAWLKKPAFSKSLKLQELAAICFSAMRPTGAAWEKMLGTLREYVADGRMSDDESVAIVASGLTETLLSQLDDNFSPDSGSINDAIERVRAELRREHMADANAEIERHRVKTEYLINAAKCREETAQEIAMNSQLAAAEAKADADRTKQLIDNRITRLAHTVGSAVTWFVVFALFAGTVMAGMGISPSKHQFLQLAIVASLGLATFWSFLGSAWGVSAKSLGAKVEELIASNLRRWVS